MSNTKGVEIALKNIHFLITPYLVAFLAVFMAMLLTLLLQPLLAPTIFLLFFAAVVVSIWYGGSKPGLFAAVLSVFVINYLFFEPIYSLHIERVEGWIRLLIFLFVAFLMSASNLQLRNAKERLEKINQELAISEAKFKGLINANIIGVITADINGTILEANDSFLDMVSYTREDLVKGRITWSVITPPENQEINTRTIKELQTQGACQPYERECICKNGDRINVLLGFALLKNNPEQVIGFVLDISERKQVETALRESQSRFAALAKATVEGVIIHENNIVLDANPAFAKMFGYQVAAVIGTSILNFFTPESQEILQKNLDSQHQKPYEITGLCANQLSIYVEVIEKSCIYQGRKVRVLAIRDITERKRAEQALKNSERRFRRLVESNIFGVAFGSISGGIQYANDYFLNMVDYDKKEMLNGAMRWDVITPLEYQEVDAQAITEILKHGVSNPYEKEFIRKDGHRISVLTGAALLQESEFLQEADHHNQNLILFCLDLSKQKTAQSERKKAETALRQREEQLRLITNALPVLISYIDTEQRYRFNNKKYEEWFGISLSEIYGKHLKEVIGETNYQLILPYVQKVLSGEQVNVETEFVYQNGKNCYFNLSLVPQFHQQGKVEGYVALIQDITEKRQASAALEASEARFRQLTEKVRVIPWQFDKSTQNFKYVGPQCEEILGYPVSEWYKNDFWPEHLHPEDRNRTLQFCEELTHKFENFELEYRMIAANGKIVWLYEIVNVVREENGVKYLHGFMIDISDRKQAEQEREQLLAREQAARSEAEAANRIKDEFLATLSHELRTPLHAVVGWTQLLRNRKFNESTLKVAMETIERNSRTLTQLIEDVLDVSHIICGKMQLNLQPLELIPVIQAAIDTISPAAEAKEIEIITKLDPNIGLVMGDSSRLQQVIWNLLSNAVKFTPRQGKIEIELQRVSSRVQIQVKDNGGGIDANFLPHVFERFRQADSSITRAYGGLGLGLAIVRHLVELHGGTVQAESPGIGQGATFTVNLPMRAITGEIVEMPPQNQ
ncbi:MAG TPA: PAS domain S-box protein [Nostocaceae cyanobacterium]|nr:PAS domain S-box protein [Nostocaceae cyanobacterium]